MSMTLPSEDLAEVNEDGHRLNDQLLRCSSKGEALEIAIKAAETSMKALRLATDPNEKSRHSMRVKQVLEEAERIKLSQDWKHALRPLVGLQTNPDSSGTAIRSLKAPCSTRALPKSEQILLYKASYVNGFKFPPWTRRPTPDEFALNNGEQPFLDTPELRLSTFQQEVFDGWRRPADSLPPPSWFSTCNGDRTNLGPSMTFLRKIDLVQDAATDCSVIASLCAGVSRAEHGHAKLLQGVFHPYDTAAGRPLMSENGKYVVRLNFNGCYRRVVVDDRLPVSKAGRVIHVVDRHNPGLLWPALIEKAYLKVRGGYDFPGSNSGTDLWIMFGWVPEQVFLQSDDLEPHRFWTRILSAFHYGDVLITMGTGKISARAERELGLAGEHDYAVLDLREADGQRLLLIKNPWCQGMSWRGRFKQNPQRTENKVTTVTVDILLIDLDEHEPVQSSRDVLNSDDQLSTGAFWMDLDSVIQYFESIYLNWNPGLFKYRQDVHFAWDLSPSDKLRGRFASLSGHPQYMATLTRGGTMWLLLCRHFQNSIPASTPDDEVENVRQDIDLTGFISLHAVCSQGRRVMLAERVLEKSGFVDSPQILLKLDDCEAGMPYTIVPCEQELPAMPHTFTLSAFSNSPITLAEATQRYTYATTLNAAWTKDTAGGNAHSPTYSTNPQFAIAVPHRTCISLLLETANDELNVHVKLAHGRGQRVHTIRNRDIVFDSKDYRRGCCVAEYSDLEPGNYTIICSTFEAQQLGNFVLLVGSSQPTQAQLLPREGAGRMRTKLSNVAFKNGQTKVAAPLVPRRLSKIYAITRPLDSRQLTMPLHTGTMQRSQLSTSSLVRISIEFGRGVGRRILITSGGGEYSDSAGGLRTEEIDLSPDLRRYGDCWLVLDRMYVSAEAQEERYSVDLYVDQPDAVDVGVWRVWDD